MTHTHTPCAECARLRRNLRCNCGGPPETEHSPDCEYEHGLEDITVDHDDAIEATA